ncbi:MAG: AAA family ATPase [Eubacterium sp.]|nr:AAA family ATPase [Eubacterium sp.]
MSEKDDKTSKLIDEVMQTKRNLLSNIYDDFYGGTKLDRNAAVSGTAATADNNDKSSEEETAATGTAEATAQKEPEEDPMVTLDKLIGLEQIKKDVRELADFAKVQKARKDAGMKSVPISMHLVFTGNPGTGKTTVARILAKIYKNIGVLPTGQLVETDRSGLVAGYVGQTAIKTQGLISKALGGILFIDEAYALSQKDDAFGQEAIDTLLKAMEDHREELVVIVAGYTEPMEKFINSNPGLKSRFNKYFEFPDYTMDELIDIFKLDCTKYDYTISEDTLKHVRELLAARRLASIDNFANARDVRNLFETIVTNQARRVAGLKDPTREQMMEILPEDLIDEPEETSP